MSITFATLLNDKPSRFSQQLSRFILFRPFLCITRHILLEIFDNAENTQADIINAKK